MKCPHCGKDTDYSPEALASFAKVAKLMGKAVKITRRKKLKKRKKSDE